MSTMLNIQPNCVYNVSTYNGVILAESRTVASRSSRPSVSVADKFLMCDCPAVFEHRKQKRRRLSEKAERVPLKRQKEEVYTCHRDKHYTSFSVMK